MMRVVSWNIDGLSARFDEIRALADTVTPDFICLQKVRCNEGRGRFCIDGYSILSTSDDAGSWSGVMTYARTPGSFRRISTGRLSADGHLQVYRTDSFTLVNAYVPFANPRIEGAVAYRRDWDAEFRCFLQGIAQSGPLVVCGDFNVVHTIADSPDESVERAVPCFTEWERDNFSLLLAQASLVDVYRSLHPEERAATYFGNSRNRSHGYRIDYIFASLEISSRVSCAEILTGFGSAPSVPVMMDLDIQ